MIMCVFFPVTARAKQGLGGKGEFVVRWETQPAPSCSASPAPTSRSPRLAGAFHVGAGRACVCPAVGLWVPQPCKGSQP